MQWHQSVRYGCSTPLIVESGCYLCSGSWCEFVSLSVSVWLFQMLKWIISQKLLNVQWKVVTETPVSDFQLFFPPTCTEIRMCCPYSTGFTFGSQNEYFCRTNPKMIKKDVAGVQKCFSAAFFVVKWNIYLSHLCLSYVSELLGLTASPILWHNLSELTLYIWRSALYSNLVMINKCIVQDFMRDHIVNIWLCDESPTCIFSCVMTLDLYML